MLLSPDLDPHAIQLVLNALPMPVFFKDRAGIYRGCNEAFAAFLGLKVDEIIGKSVFDIAPSDLAQIYFDADEALMSEGITQSYESQVQWPGGQRVDVIFSKMVMRDPSGQVSGLVGCMVDITERKRMERELANMANQDALTGLLNRRAILAHLDDLFRDRREQLAPLCVLMCDIDHFKAVNDQYGHGAGDEVLKMTAQALRQDLRDGDQLGRIGGEEFLVVLQSTDSEHVAEVAERLRQLVASLSIPYQGQDLSITVSIGAARSLTVEEDWASIMTRADHALYAAKRAGRNRVMLASWDGTGAIDASSVLQSASGLH